MNTEQIDRIKLVKKAMRGNRAAQVRLCEEEAGHILYMCVRLMGNPHDGQDAAQEVLIKLQSGITRLQNPESFSAWLHRILSHTCSNMRRDAMKQSIPVEDEILQLREEHHPEFLPEAFAEREESRALVLRCMDEMPPQYREVLLLFYYQGLSMQAIAAALATDEKAVKNLLYRARQSLKKQVGQAGVLHSAAPLATGAVPVLSRILQADKAAVASSEAVRHVLLASGVCAAATAGAAAGQLTALFTAAGAVVASGVIAFTAVPAGAGPSPLQHQPPVSFAAEAFIESLPSHPPSESASPSSQASPVPAAESGAPRGQAVSAPAAQAAPPAEPAAPAAQVYTMSGSLAVVTEAGAPLATMSGFAEGFTVQALRDGQVIAAAGVDAAGGYTLAFSYTPGGHTLCVIPAAGSALAFGPQNPAGSLAFTPQDGGVLPTLTFTDNEAPTGSIWFYGAAGQDLQGGNVGASTAGIQVSDATAVFIAWQVLSADGAVLLSGEGPEASLAALPGSEEGAWYTLVCTLIDAAGNTGGLQREFVRFNDS